MLKSRAGLHNPAIKGSRSRACLNNPAIKHPASYAGNGLTYDTCGYFASWENTSNEQNVREYCTLNHRIRDLLFHYKKGVILFQFYLVKLCPSGRLQTM